MISARLKSYTAALMLATFGALCTAGAPHAAPLAANAIPGELIVKFKSGASDAQIEHGLKLGRLKPKRHLQTEAMHQRGDVGLTLTETLDPVEQVLQRLQNHPAIEFAEPNLRYHHHAVSNDPYVTSGHLWGLYGDLGSPTNIYGTQAIEAWNAGYTGTNSVFVAVIDEGINTSHPDLAPNIWTNPFDLPDGLDNDGNGYVDDIHGWNFAANTNVVFDPEGDTHGTHVAGTIGAKGGNALGVAGVNWNVTMIAAKFLGTDGGTTLDAIEAIDYFVGLKERHGINLVAINASWGSDGYSQALHSAVIRAAKAGILFITAAGNDGLNNDLSGSYPANFDTRKATSTETAASYDAVISVAALDDQGLLATFSNYGATNVDIGAPGVRILSTYPTNRLAYMDGSSMATPHVTGAAALYASTHPGATAESIRAALLNSALPTPSLAGKTVTGKRLDLGGVIAPPIAAPTGLTALAGNATVALVWKSVPGATSYLLKRSLQSGGPYLPVTTALSGTNYTDTSVLNGSTYFYVVSSVNSFGPGPDSAHVSASPPLPGASAFVVTDDLTSGAWRGVYGAEGAFAYPYGTFLPPSYVKLSAYRNYPLTWETSTADPRALLKSSGTNRFAAAWHSTNDLHFNLNFTDTNSHRVSFYFVDYDRQGREQLLEFFDLTTGKLLASQRIASFGSGRYSTWTLQGNVRLKLTRLAGPNCVLSAFFFDSAAISTGPYVGSDTVTSGSWKGIHGAEGGLAYPYGYFVPPTYVQLSAYKNYGLLWSDPTADLRALQKPSGTQRMAGAWHSTNDFHFNLQFKDTAKHAVSLYFVDFDRAGRQQKLEVIDQSTGTLLDTKVLSNFENGVYLTYNLSGNIRLKITRLAGPNCVMSAILFGPALLP